MLGPVLDTVIAMAGVYLVLSLLCTAIQEFLAQMLRLRAKNLREGLDDLLSAPIAQTILAHGIMTGLSPKGRAPTRIPADRFVAAVWDLYAAGGEAEKDVRKSLDEIPEPRFREAAIALYEEAAGDAGRFRRRLAAWFDESMEALGGAYRAKVQIFLVAIATVVTVTLNFDSLRVAESIWRNGEAREALVAVGTSLADQQSLPAFERKVLDAVSEQLPIGWDLPDTLAQIEAPTLPDLQDGLRTLFGWLISIAALSFGAPFWFDILKSVVNIRGDGSQGGSQGGGRSGGGRGQNRNDRPDTPGSPKALA